MNKGGESKWKTSMMSMDMIHAKAKKKDDCNEC
jgi:hypothetical protein